MISVTDRANEPQYHVKEDEGYLILHIRLESLPKLKRYLTISYFTMEATACKFTCSIAIVKKTYSTTYFFFAVDGKDYRSTAATNDTFIFSRVGQAIYVRIPIIDNMRHDGKRFFLFGITSKSGIDIWLQIFIWDDEWGRCATLRIIATLLLTYNIDFRDVW